MGDNTGTDERTEAILTRILVKRALKAETDRVFRQTSPGETVHKEDERCLCQKCLDKPGPYKYPAADDPAVLEYRRLHPKYMRTGRR